MTPYTSNQDRKALIAFGMFAVIGITAVWFEVWWLFLTVVVIPIIVAIAYGDIKIILKSRYMSVKIEPLENGEYSVNGKTVYKDHNDNWIGSPSCTSIEKKFFNEYINTVERLEVKRPLIATYKQ